MKQILFILSVITIALSSCSKSKCYQCTRTESNGSFTRTNVCFDKKDKREYIKRNIEAYESFNYKCRAKLID